MRRASFAVRQHCGKSRLILLVTVLSVAVVVIAHLDVQIFSPSSVSKSAEFSETSSVPTAINLLETGFYVHHPVMRMVSQEAVKFDKDFLVEINDLYVPARFDCENLDDDKRTWGGFSYFKSNPARWYACWLHHASLRSGLPGMVPPLPLIDEEYFEHVSVYDSVLRANDKYVVAELGARWGTWGARAVAFLKKVKPMPYNVLFVEPLAIHCKGIREVMKKNRIDYDLICDYAKAEDFVNWAANQTHVNLLDLDIQGAEEEFFASDDVMRVVEKKVHRIILGTHSNEIHAAMQKRLSQWIVVHEMPMNSDLECIKKYLRKPPKPDRSNFDEIVKRKCYHESSFGKIPNYDGELILDNPRFFKGKSLFPKRSYVVED